MIKELLSVKGWKAFLEVLPEEYIPGFIMTLKVALAGLLLALALGVIFGMLSTVKVKILNLIARIYVEFFQNTPLVVQVFFYYNCLPFVIGGRVPKFVIGVIGVGIYHGAYISEVIRTGIEAVPRGQFDAAYSQGFTYIQTMRYIIMPQAMKNILPAMGNEFVVLIKETAVIGMVANIDLVGAARKVQSLTFDYVIPLLSVAAIYYVVIKIISIFLNKLEASMRKSDKR